MTATATYPLIKRAVSRGAFDFRTDPGMVAK